MAGAVDFLRRGHPSGRDGAAVFENCRNFNFWAPGALVLILRKQREYRELIVIGGCLVVQVGVTAVAQRNEVTRRLVEHAHIGQMVHLRRALPAVLAQMVCAFERRSAAYLPIG